MILYESGNLFAYDGATARVNAVNCVGVAGAGIALEFRRRYPDVFRRYRSDCESGLYRPGDVRGVRAHDGRTVYNAATKDHWRKPSRVEWVDLCLANLDAAAVAAGGERVAVPALGCGLGGLAWDTFRMLAEERLRRSTVLYVVFVPERRE